jgi:hypothetical protein
VQQLAGEEHNLVLPGNDRLVTPFAFVMAVLEPRVVDPQFAAFEATRFAMKKVNECQMSSRNRIAAVVAVAIEKVPVIAGRDLHFNGRNAEVLHAKLLQNIGQYGFDALEHNLLMIACVHQDPRTAVLIVHHASFGMRRKHFAGMEIGLMIERKARQFF